MNMKFGGIYAIFAAAIIGLMSFILAYLVKLERTGCECAMDWRRRYLVGYFIYLIVVNLILLPQYLLPENKFYKPFVFAMAPLNLVLSVMFIIFTIQYVNRLKREKCECSKQTAREVMYYYAWVSAGMFALVGTILLSFIIIAFAMRSR